MPWAVDPYVDPRTGVLRNRLGIEDAGELARREFLIATERAAQLAEGPVAGRFDRAHLAAVHARLFGDVYDWAGRVRTIGIVKSEPVLGGRSVPYPHPDPAHAPEDLGTRLDHALDGLAADGTLDEPDRERFADRLAHHVVEIWLVHAFREGNTRTVTALAHQIARAAGHALAADFPAEPARYRDALVVAAAGGDRAALDRQVRSALGLDLREARPTLPDPDEAEVTAARERLARETERRLVPTVEAHLARVAELRGEIGDARRALDAFDVRHAGRATPRGARGDRVRLERRELGIALERAQTRMERYEDSLLHGRVSRETTARALAARALPEDAAVVRRAEERAAFDTATAAWRETERRLDANPTDRSIERLAAIHLDRLLNVHANRSRLRSGERERLGARRRALAPALERGGR